MTVIIKYINNHYYINKNYFTYFNKKKGGIGGIGGMSIKSILKTTPKVKIKTGER